ncbi:hypothetical protein HD553DRAFT_358244 [Filobasidium floriforme]|uniref:uncharacterized protein n=1 Tax=Filobasidium floriforme TaxID=5210 RepID=UPI001E8EF2AC|nr:uncharacterized protein HD553DRAFT_358244 [Filobasidium floriforme]KAH8082207.1 hypothetical protein HD553DRAFT_358244 [Filobasidium floriforme]
MTFNFVFNYTLPASIHVGWHRPILALIPINPVLSSRLVSFPSSSSSRTSLLEFESPLQHFVFFIFVHVRPESFRTLRQTSLTPSVCYCPQRSSSIPVNGFFFSLKTRSSTQEGSGPDRPPRHRSGSTTRSRSTRIKAQLGGTRGSGLYTIFIDVDPRVSCAVLASVVLWSPDVWLCWKLVPSDPSGKGYEALRTLVPGGRSFLFTLRALSQRVAWREGKRLLTLEKHANCKAALNDRRRPPAFFSQRLLRRPNPISMSICRAITDTSLAVLASSDDVERVRTLQEMIGSCYIFMFGRRADDAYPRKEE